MLSLQDEAGASVDELPEKAALESETDVILLRQSVDQEW